MSFKQKSNIIYVLIQGLFDPGTTDVFGNGELFVLVSVLCIAGCLAAGAHVHTHTEL